MRLSFFGAAGEVTGSCTMLETGRSRVLIDFGLHQGGAAVESRNRRTHGIEGGAIDAVVLTHAHIDHSGRLPLLVRPASAGGVGYRGPIWATPATIDLAEILLRDSAHLQQSEAQRISRHRLRRGSKEVRALYSLEDAERAISQMKPLPYESAQEVAHGVSARFRDAGHILGSASVLLHARANGSERSVVFSGDIGPRGSPLLRDPRPFESADCVVLESTYGDREHRAHGETIEEFAGLLREAHADRSKVIIPAFAVGRTQQLIYHLGVLMRSGELPETPVYIDSPMAMETTELYRRHKDCYDEKTRAMIESGDRPLSFPSLHFARSVEESRRLNDLDCCAIIISASGMCNGGRILHHLRHSIWRAGTRLVFVGFQAHGTLGRRIVDGAKRVTIMNEPVAVKASVHTIGGFSAHAGRAGLLSWLEPMAGARPRVILTHGEEAARRSLAGAVEERFGVSPVLPEYKGTVEL